MLTDHENPLLPCLRHPLLVPPTFHSSCPSPLLSHDRGRLYSPLSHLPFQGGIKCSPLLVRVCPIPHLLQNPPLTLAIHPHVPSACAGVLPGLCLFSSLAGTLLSHPRRLSALTRPNSSLRNISPALHPHSLRSTRDTQLTRSWDLQVIRTNPFISLAPRNFQHFINQ